MLVPPPRVVLNRPLYGGNVGSCARAMANFGLRDLRLVAPEFTDEHEEFSECAQVHLVCNPMVFEYRYSLDFDAIDVPCEEVGFRVKRTWLVDEGRILVVED